MMYMKGSTILTIGKIAVLVYIVEPHARNYKVSNCGVYPLVTGFGVPVYFPIFRPP